MLYTVISKFNCNGCLVYNMFDLQPLPEGIEDSFLKAVSEFFPLVSHDERVGAVITKMEETEGVYAPISPSDLAPFNKAYFLRNCLKCMIAINHFPKILNMRSLYDVGCGLGTATVAWKLLSPKAGAQNIFTLFDRAESQLKAAKYMFNHNVFENDIAIFESAEDSLPPMRSNSLSIFSYSLCEMKSEKHKNRYVKKLCGNDILIIDYKEVLTNFVRKNRSNFLRFQLVSEVYVLPETISLILGQKDMKVSFLNAKW